MPDTGTGKAINDFDAESLGSPGGLLKFFDGTLVHARGIPVTPYVVGQDGFVPLVNQVAHRLANQVTANGLALQVVFVQQRTLGIAIAIVGHRLVHLEMIPPTGQFDALISEFGGLSTHFFDA